MPSKLKANIKRFPLLANAARKLLRLYSKVKAGQTWNSLAQKEKIWLELGSGEKKGKNGWITVDIKGADINWDLRDGIPLKDSSVDRIYSSHLLEHIPYPALLGFLRECRRVLKVDGEFSVCVPNAGIYLDHFITGTALADTHVFYEPAVVKTGSKLDIINYIAYMDGEHKYMFNQENLINTLKVSGFSNSELRSFDPEIDLIERDFESVYAMARK